MWLSPWSGSQALPLCVPEHFLPSSSAPGKMGRGCRGALSVLRVDRAAIVEPLSFEGFSGGLQTLVSLGDTQAT